MSDTTPHPRVALRHRMEWRFDRPVQLSTHWLRLCPAPHTPAHVDAYTLNVGPQPHFLNWLRDPFENHLGRLDFPQPVDHCRLDMECILTLAPRNPFDFLLEPDAAEHPFSYTEQLARELAPYLRLPKQQPLTRQWLTSLENGAKPTTARLASVVQAAHDVCVPGSPASITPPSTDQVLATGAGDARALAWLLTLGLRQLGIAARLVSGYRIDGTEGAYSACLHTWSDAYLPGAGWIGLDPAANLFTAERHVPLTTAADPLRIAPVIGYREACEESHDDAVDIQALVPAAPAWPYSNAQRQAMDSAGSAVDAALSRHDITLAVSNAPEFTRPGDDSSEWRFTGLGPDKRDRGLALVTALRDRLLPHGLIQHTQQDWYAGEAEPRWRLLCVASTYGQPIWPRSSTAADQAPDAAAFAQALSFALGLPGDAPLAAHEDALHRHASAGTERPEQPSARDLASPEARLALLRRLGEDHDAITGYLLPLYPDRAQGVWRTGRWPTRHGRVTLSPGSWPMGFRLPLDALPVADSSRVSPPPTTSPWDTDAARRPLTEGANAGDASHPVLTTTAVCVEVRDDSLYVFLPPLPDADTWSALVRAVATAADSTGIAVTLEGYPPPPDVRLQRLTVDPDTGTLRVTIPPLRNWHEEAAWLEATYAEAARLGLAPEREAGDHPVPAGHRAVCRLGGPTPWQSPFLQRPGLLRSLLVYWQRHPALSWCFAGPHVGPDGWAPRIDEAGRTAVHELEMALERLADGECPTPWLADRVLSHLLVDTAGQANAGEFRLDDLYPPHDDSRRLGQFALHAFATAPHADLAAARSLLLRALLHHLVVQPHYPPLTDWGPALHDRFLLPQVLRDDLHAVIAELRATGVALDPAWFEPLLERGFPLLGELALGAVHARLRPALEPRPVLAEEATGGGTFRFMDPATARYEVCLSGLTPGREILLCNGHPVPLQPTGVPGTMVAAVRCKVVQPPLTLHPAVPPVEALVFDLVDTWTGRNLGGFTYWPPRQETEEQPAAPSHQESMPTAAGAGGRPFTPVEAAARPPSISVPGRFLPGGSAVTSPAAMPRKAPEQSYLLDLADPRHLYGD